MTSVGIQSGAMEGDRRLVGGREEEEGDCQREGLQQGSRGSSRGPGRGLFPVCGSSVTLPKIEEPWVMEGDRRLGGRAEEEGCCQKEREREGGGVTHWGGFS